MSEAPERAGSRVKEERHARISDYAAVSEAEGIQLSRGLERHLGSEVIFERTSAIASAWLAGGRAP